MSIFLLHLARVAVVSLGVSAGGLLTIGGGMALGRTRRGADIGLGVAGFGWLLTIVGPVFVAAGNL